MVAIPFPVSSLPGQRPGEGQGRLINSYAEKNGNEVLWRRAPGLVTFADTGKSAPRGMIDVGGTLYSAFDGVAVTVSAGGTTTPLTGTVSGVEPVTWARNNKSPTPDVALVTEDGAFLATTTTVSDYGDPDLPQPNSVSSLDGYFLFTVGDGTIYASGLNDPSIDALSFAKAESDPDGLIRGIVSGSQFYAFGPGSLEIWSNAGTQPFPLSRTAVVPVGLIGPWAVAGFGSGWDQTPIFVAQDATVRKMNGYTPQKVSTPDVERAIQGVPDKSALRASVYVVAGHAVWVLSSPSWTWCYDVSTDAWFERQSYGAQRWRGSTGVKFADRWLVGDLGSGKLLEVTEASGKEDGDPLIFEVESGAVRNFPKGFRIPDAEFDMTVGQGDPNGAEDEIDPKLELSWSHDGGADFGNPLLHSLGQIGQFNKRIRQNRLGRATQQGIRFRLRVPAANYVTLRAGVMRALGS